VLTTLSFVACCRRRPILWKIVCVGGKTRPSLAAFSSKINILTPTSKALTGIPFPVASTLCTRFATQINFRRAAHESVIVTIIPNKDSGIERAAGLKSFNRKVSSLTPTIFADLLSEASEAMGLPIPGQEISVDESKSGMRFADDVLKIELCGPARPHFSVVDVPGLFQSMNPVRESCGAHCRGTETDACVQAPPSISPMRTR
jgi:hypothetical protein